MKNNSNLQRFKLNINKCNNKTFITSLKLNYFNLNYFLVKAQNFPAFIVFIIVIIEYMQLFSFPINPNYSDHFQNSHFKQVSQAMQYFYLLQFWAGYWNLHYAVLISISWFIVFILSLWIYTGVELSKMNFEAQILLNILAFLFNLNSVLGLPFVRIYFSLFRCESNHNYYFPELKCYSPTHIILSITALIFILIWFIWTFLIQSTFFDDSPETWTARAKVSSEVTKTIMVIQLLLILIYELIPKKTVIWSIITFIFSLFWWYHYIEEQPYFHQVINKICIIFHYSFCWASWIVVFSCIDANFSGGWLLIVIGFWLITFGIVVHSATYSMKDIIEANTSTFSEAEYLKHISLWWNWISNNSRPEYRKDKIMLYGYILKFEFTCNVADCALKQYLHYNSLKLGGKEGVADNYNVWYKDIFWLQHMEIVFKAAIAKYPWNVRLRLGYANWLYGKWKQKQKALVEWTMIERFETSWEDEYLLFNCRKKMQEESQKNNPEINNIIESSTWYKGYTKIFKETILKVSIWYIDFWALLSMNNELQMDNFSKMNELGNRINDHVRWINDYFHKMQKINDADKDALDLYSRFWSEIWNNQKKSGKYLKRWEILEESAEKYEDINMEKINIKDWNANENCKFIIVSAENDKLGNIINISLPIWSLFGYIKKEIIGQPLDILMPEIFRSIHRKILRNKYNDYKRAAIKMIVNPKEESNKLREISTYARNKAKYWIPVKLKIGIITTDEGETFFACKVWNETKTPEMNNHLLHEDNQPCLILTDTNWIIQNFTSNAVKLMNLNSSSINSSIELTEYIKEFNEEFLKNFINWDNQDQDKKKLIKQYIINRKYRSPAEVTWWLNENMNQSINFGSSRFKSSKFKLFNVSAREISGDSFALCSNHNYGNGGNQISMGNVSSPTNKVIKPILKPSWNGTIISSNNNNSVRFLKQENNNNNNTNINNNDYTLKISHWWTCHEQQVLNLSPKHNNTRYLSDNKYKSNDRFTLSVEDMLINQTHVGYWFRFEISNNPGIKKNPSSPINSYKVINSLGASFTNSMKKNGVNLGGGDAFGQGFNSNGYSSTNNNNNSNRNNNNNNYAINPSWKDSQNPAKAIKGDFIPETMETFMWDIDKMAFKQRTLEAGDKAEKEEIVRANLQNLALMKIKNLTHIKTESQSSSNLEDSSFTSSSNNSYSSVGEESASANSVNNKRKPIADKDNSSAYEMISMKSDNNFDKITPSQPQESNCIALKKTGGTVKFMDDYYHVNIEKIILWMYNYNTQVTEGVKNSTMNKYSEIELKTQSLVQGYQMDGGDRFGDYLVKNSLKNSTKHWGDIKQSNNQSLEHRKSDKNTEVKEEVVVIDENKVLMKQIKKALGSKDTQPSIIKLRITSSIMFMFIAILAVVTLTSYWTSKENIANDTDLIFKTTEFHKRLLFNGFLIRELVLSVHSNYTNLYGLTREKYFSNITSSILDGYFKINAILSSLITNIHHISEKSRKKLSEAKIVSIVWDDIVDLSTLKPGDERIKTKQYEIGIISMLLELNTAWYHVVFLDMATVRPWEENIFYYMQNSLNNVLWVSEQISSFFLEMIWDHIKEHIFIFSIQMSVAILLFIVTYFVLISVTAKVEERKSSYLTVFFEIGSGIIYNSLTKCEKFTQQIQLENEMDFKEISLESSIESDPFTENPDWMSIKSSAFTKKRMTSEVKTGRTKVNLVSHRKNNIYILLFVIFLLIANLALYLVLILFQNEYSTYAQFIYHYSVYEVNFYSIWIYNREWIFDHHLTIANENIEDYVIDSMDNTYSNISEKKKKVDEFINMMPREFLDKYDEINTESLCDYLEDYLAENPQNRYYEDTDILITCDNFASGILNHGLKSLLPYYIEQNRLFLQYFKILEDALHTANLTSSLNLTYYRTEHYYSIEPDDPDLKENFYEIDPMALFNCAIHVELVLLFRFIFRRLMLGVVDILNIAIFNIYSTNKTITIALEVIFFCCLIFGFLFAWIPFVQQWNSTIYKTKNMLSIIPREFLAKMPHTKKMLCLEQERPDGAKKK